MAARIGSVIDSREVVLERDGLAKRMRSSFGVILLDEGIDDERPPLALIDRLAFQVDLDAVRWSEATGSAYGLDDVRAARARLPHVQESEDIACAICEAAMLLGIASLRAPLAGLAGGPCGRGFGRTEHRFGHRRRACRRPGARPTRDNDPRDGETAGLGRRHGVRCGGGVVA